jgi:hypothetical protein
MAKYTIIRTINGFDETITVEARDFQYEVNAPMVTFFTAESHNGFSVPVVGIRSIELAGIRESKG